jgi:hypothetical protein
VVLKATVFLLPAPVLQDLVLSPPDPVDPSDHLSHYLLIYCNQFLTLHTLSLKMEAASSLKT